MRTVLRVFGECCLTAGVIVLLFLAYLMWGTAAATSAHQHAFATQLQRQWGTHRDANPVTTGLHLVTGQPFAFIQRPHEAVITLITCDPPWTGTHRIIVFGSLDAQTPRTGHNS
jgi:hypothetical protein